MTPTFADYERFEIMKGVNEALVNAFSDPSQSEPQLVANLVWHIPSVLNSIVWKGTRSVRSGGIFVHAQPIVESKQFPKTTPKGVEIGDLLLLRTNCEDNVVTERRALLLQAKKSKSIPTTPDNENQHYLYANWPTVKYGKRSGKLTGKQRSVKGMDLYNGAKYLLLNGEIKTGHPSYCPDYPYLIFEHEFWCCRMKVAQPTMPDLSHYECFTKELVEFICGDRGKGFQTPPPARKRDWNRVIYDLLSNTAEIKSKFMKQGSGDARNKRGVAVRFVSGLESVGSLAPNRTSISMVTVEQDGLSDQIGEIPPEPPKVFEDNDDHFGGISIIEFLVNSNNQQNFNKGSTS